MQSTVEKIDSFDHQENLAVVDALRGYAILLVIGSHVLGHVESLVWPAKRLLLIGVYGVQLFFIASSLTLLMSWARSNDPFWLRTFKFLIRRFFRIAPLYFLAIIFYWFVAGRTLEEFNLGVLGATLLFYNAWSPYLIPTVPGWMPVPGGWSISVEFCFYLILPFLAVSISSIGRSLSFFFISVLLMIAAEKVGMFFYPEISVEERANFLYFWPLNHLAIFALGILLYQCVKSDFIKQKILTSKLNAGYVTLIFIAIIIAISFYGQRKFFDLAYGLPPTHLLISILFLLWSLILLVKPHVSVVNRAITALGKVSFSAYIIHFAALKLADTLLDRVWPFPTSGFLSVAYAAVLIIIAVAITWYMSRLTYKFIEQPFISVGKYVTGKISLKFALLPAKA